MRITTLVNEQRGTCKLIIEGNGSPDIWCESMAKAIELCGTMSGSFEGCRTLHEDRNYILSIALDRYCARKAIAAAIFSARHIVRKARHIRGNANMTLELVA